ncbi:hypothetical protein R9K83_12110, partial [Escherichia coli]|nr:hypothetical protein [Escherichia coli]MCI3725328.1 hypothetical protein [Escherichia coli]MCK2887808.1 hypothetical protein [Escherichia coli]MCK2959893.1 hypothetical protein [Escherichia coli]MDV1780590.1 hypothetical protein [Escherichia coli]
ADRNRSHWSTSKTPSYTKSVSWQHHPVTKLLKLPQHVLPLFGLCLGWPADNPDLKPRLPASILVHENSYQPLDKGALAQYDEQLAEYYLTRGSNNRRDTWSDHIRRTIIKESRPFILDYLHKQGWATR